jgi:hypothetical protein
MHELLKPFWRIRNLSWGSTVRDMRTNNSVKVLREAARAAPRRSRRAGSPSFKEKNMRENAKKRTAVDAPASASVRVAELGESIYQQMAGTIESTNRDQFIVINLKTKSHVIATTRDEVMDRYEELFGTAPGYLRRIGSLDYGGNVRL